MYNPGRFKSENINEAFELMDKHPFATVISVAENKPFISHLPLTPKRNGEKIELIGHLARANPHSKLLSCNMPTILFHGPHTYITPQWYTDSDVPTWNYTALHVSGQVELIEDYEGIVGCLKELTAHVERHWPSGWEFFVPEDLAANGVLAKSIVGFKIKVTEINFKKKLGQNRSPADIVGVMRGLESRRDDNSRWVLEDMLKIY